ncbi:hypothetical protein Tco_1252373 [Tanacetum coccineum]
MRSLQMDVDDEISNLVDLHMGMFGGGWKWQDLQGLLWLDHHKRQGKVKGGGVDFGVINSLLGEILRDVMGEME